MATNDFSKMMQDMMASMPMDMSAMSDALKGPAAYSGKMSKLVLDAAAKSTDVSAAWTKASIAKMSEVATAKNEPADYTKAMADFATAQANMAAEHMVAFAEIAKRVQMETVELMLAAGKDASAEAAAAVQKATSEVTTAAKKAADEMSAVTKNASSGPK